ncbi:neuronal acetylcholine receptor subunit alpha-5-like [Branchiostoma lanceolatum]|uniref:neuronal acetylcholine receptor subunit alpha-5-like n=1 Tax=Branchiostoma lanceolatum TaxID=7740 RepID=UPI003456F021
MNYRGTWSRTTSGEDCVDWSTAQAGFYPIKYPWANMENNYCRNPTGLERPFCLVKDGSQEECDIIPCSADICWDMGSPNYGIRSPGKRFYHVGERVTFTCNEGYILKSGYTSKVRCIEGGIWQYDKPSCSVDIKGRLEEELLGLYSLNQAPEIDDHTRSIISFNGSVEHIVNLDEKREMLVASVVIELTWQDSRLEWDPKYYENIRTFSAQGSNVWTPSLSLKRNADPLYQGLPKDVPLEISTDGTVIWRVETLTSTICDADPYLFPADTMDCSICLSASSAIEQIIECGEGASCDVWSPRQTEGEWYRKDRIFAKGDKEACFAINLERIPLFHIATTIGPCVILVVLMTITFIMPIDRGDRISFGVTILLSMVVSLVFVTEVLPVKGALPFFATLIVVCMGLMGLFLFFTMGIITLYDKEGNLPPMAKTFFLRYMAKFLLLGDLMEKEAASDDGEADSRKQALAVDEESPAEISEIGLTIRNLACSERPDDASRADYISETGGESLADVTEAINQSPTRLEVTSQALAVDEESPAEISEIGLTIRNLACSERPDDASRAEYISETGGESLADVNEATKQSPTRLEVTSQALAVDEESPAEISEIGLTTRNLACSERSDDASRADYISETGGGKPGLCHRGNQSVTHTPGGDIALRLL